MVGTMIHAKIGEGREESRRQGGYQLLIPTPASVTWLYPMDSVLRLDSPLKPRTPSKQIQGANLNLFPCISLRTSIFFLLLLFARKKRTDKRNQRRNKQKEQKYKERERSEELTPQSYIPYSTTNQRVFLIVALTGIC